MKTFASLLLVLCAATSYADRNTPIKVMALANGTLMSSPPLPSLYGKKGKSILKIQPAYFSGELGNSEDDSGGSSSSTSLVNSSEYSGFAAAVLWSQLINESFGWYVMGMGNRTTGQFSFNITDPSNDSFQLDVTDVNSTLLMGSVGLSYTLFANSRFPLQVFGGPAMAVTDVEQTVRTIGADSQDDDFDMTLSPATPSFVAGVQVGIQVSEWLLINPYFVISQLINESDKCQSFEAVVRQTGPLFDFGDPGCQEGLNSSTSQIEYDTGFSAYGVYITVPKWNLSVNVFAEADGPDQLQEAEIQLFALNFSFVF